MQLIEPEVNLIGEKNPLIKIEKIGRVCYKSNSEYTEDTAVRFIQSLIKSGHTSVLEHVNFIFEVSDHTYEYYPFVNYSRTLNMSSPPFSLGDQATTRCLASTNLRAILENNYTLFMAAILKVYPKFKDIFPEGIEERARYQWGSAVLIEDLSVYSNVTAEEVRKHMYYTFQFLTDRGVTHEMVRHRIASFTQESTRFCNYSNDKFGNEIRCIRPAEWDTWDAGRQSVYENTLKYAETSYMRLIQMKATPQQARGVLPTDLATTIVMTANVQEWNHFFNLRSRGTTGKPHPNMQYVATKALGLFESDLRNKGIIF